MSKIKIIVEFMLRDVPIHVINILTSFLPNHMISNRLRGFLINPFLGKCGKKLQIGRGVIINNPGQLFVGDDCYLSHYCYVQAKGKITFGNNVIMGPMAVIASSNHIIIDAVVTNKGVNMPVNIGSGTYCGGHCVITSGVTIGNQVIVGAGAVVTKNIDSNSKVVGVPARNI